jgi:hypothetical protein
MPLRFWYPLTAAFSLLGVFALEAGSLILSSVSFVVAVWVGFAGAAKHGMP